MKRLVFIALLLLSFGVQGQNRFPSIDSAKNYVLRYVKNSAVESFTNLRMQNVVYGTLQLLDSLAGAGAVDSIWIGTGDTLKYRVGSGTFVVGKIGGGTYTFTNGLTESGGVVKLGGTLTEETFVDGNQQITFLLRENVNNSIYWLNQKGVTVSDTLNNNSGGIYLNRFDGITTSYIGSDSIKLHNGDGVSPYTRTTASLFGNQLLAMNTTTGAVSRFTGSVLTSTPTLAQVTAAGNSTTDTINVKANNNTSVVQIYSDNSSTPKFGKVRLYRTLPSDYAEYSHESITYNVDGGFSKRLYWGASLPTQNRDYFFPDTSGNLSVGVKLNGTTYMAGSNGIADIPYDTVAIATFGAGAGLSTDTAAFQTTSVYGSFYHDGTDTLIITQMRIGLQGTSPNITTEVYWNDSLNVTAGATILVSGGTAATNTATGTNVTSFTNTKIPPGNWVWVRTSAVTTKPTYFSLTLIGYRKRK